MKTLAELTAADIKALASEAEKWIQKSGRKDIEKALDKATEAANKLSNNRLVDPQSLRAPLNL